MMKNFAHLNKDNKRVNEPGVFEIFDGDRQPTEDQVIASATQVISQKIELKK